MNNLPTQELVQKNRQMVDQREEALATIDSEIDQDQHRQLTAELTKAKAIMAKSQGNYQKLVTSTADLLHTGSGRVPLLNSEAPEHP